MLVLIISGNTCVTVYSTHKTTVVRVWLKKKEGVYSYTTSNKYSDQF